MKKLMLIMAFLIMVLCSLFVFADPIPIPHKGALVKDHKYYHQDLGILCPMLKRNGFAPIGQCQEWYKNN